MISIIRTNTRLTASYHLFVAYYWILLLLVVWCQLLETVESKSYKLYDSSDIHLLLDEWKVQYPDLVRLTTAQEAYGLSTAGSAEDCPFYQGDGCPNAILTIQDYITHPVGSTSSNALPEVFWSGSLHGNERVGPTVVMETALLLLEAATCESYLQHVSTSTSTTSSSVHKTKAAHKTKARAHHHPRTHDSASTSCRTTLTESGIGDVQRRWLARLVSTRRIVIVPTANALGFYQNARTEDGLDPNRDFPYDLEDVEQCMQTIAARTLNEVFRDHMFQMALTFHAGYTGIAYEWGAPSWYGSLSPDDVAQSQIAAAYSEYAGGTRTGTTTTTTSFYYEYGPMNDLVYDVGGGMEDWAYAGSWDKERMLPYCEPTTYNGYSQAKTRYNNSTLRAFNMLIETGSDKNPIDDTLGSSDDLLNPLSESSGHISRNIRLSLASADLVEPYVSIVQVNDEILPHDIIPLSSSHQITNCGAINTMTVNASEIVNNKLEISFSVGGALSINQVQLWYANKHDVVAARSSDCWKQPTISELRSSPFKQAGTIVGSNSGSGQFYSNGPIPLASTNNGDAGIITDGPLFLGTIDIIPIPNSNDGEWIVLASARVDQDWKNAPQDQEAGPDHPVQPQSHMANVRTNPNWKHEISSTGKVIQGRLDWFSRPLTVVVVN